LNRIDPGSAFEDSDLRSKKFELQFTFRGVPLLARIMPHQSGSLHMQLMGLIGRLPYSAQGRERRLGAMTLLRSTASRRPTRFAVARSGNVLLAGDIEIESPVTPSRLMVAVTILVASAKPYLDIFPLFLDRA